MLKTRTQIETQPFLAACRREPTDHTPIWLMRQAGRHMPVYRALRAKYEFLEMMKTPELACEVTMQPVNAYDIDAAIIFADILPPLEGMGLDLEFIKGKGPVIHNPLSSATEVDNLIVPPAEENLWFTLDAIKLARAELDSRNLPLIGFSGAPFTLAAYAIEGGGSKDWAKTKTMMMGDSATWHKLMEKLAQLVGEYLLAQAAAGANALQLFDSWVGILSPADYREHVQPYSRRALEIASAANVPLIHFGTNTNGMLEDIRDAGGDVIGVDWRIDLGDAVKRLGPDVAIQGNLDPIALQAPWPDLQARAKYVLDQMAGRPGHIFNLGHGISPQVPMDNVKRLVDFVHEYTAK